MDRFRSLTARLVVTAVVLVALVCVLVGTVTTLALRGKLLDQLDADVVDSVLTALMTVGRTMRQRMATADLDGTFARLQASDAEVVQEPTEQPYGVRDCAFRDPAGNLIRIQELR